MAGFNKKEVLFDFRKYWAEYFDSINIRVAFWSATKEVEKQEQTRVTSQRNVDEDDGSEDEEDTDDECETMSEEEEEVEGKEVKDDVTPTESTSQTSSNVSQKNHENGTSSDTKDQIKTVDTEHNQDKTASSSQCDAPETLDPSKLGASAKLKNNSSLLDGDELIEYLRSLHDWKSNEKHVTTIGLVLLIISL